MATPPTFTAATSLAAATLNKVGLWLIKTQTVGSAASSEAVSSVFSSDFDNYLVIVSGGAGSASNALRLTLGSTTTGYYYAGKGRTYAGVDSNIDNNNVNGWWYAGETSANGMAGVIEIIAPNLATRTQYVTSWASPRTDGYYYTAGGFLDNATQYTGFTITFGTGTQTGGTIKVYGYRN